MAYIKTIKGKLTYVYNSKEQADGKLSRHPSDRWVRVDDKTYRKK